MYIKGKLRNPMTTNFISLVLLQGINYLLPLLSFPYLFRVLGVERWGLVTFGYAFMQYFVMFTDFGFNLSGTKFISQHKENIKKINSFLNSAMTGRFILCIICFFLLLLLTLFNQKFKNESFFYILYFGIVIGNVMFPMWFFQGMENMKYITMFNIIAKSLSFIPFFIIIRKPEDYIYVPICYSVGFILAGIISIFIIYNKMEMKWYFTSIKEIQHVLKDSSTYFLSRVSTSLFTTNNSFILGLACGNIAVGYYSAAEKIYQAYNQLLLPFTGVLFPHISRTKDIDFFKKIFYRISIINLFFVTITILSSTYILQIVYGTSDPNIPKIFQILLLACFVTIPSMLLGYPFLAAMGHPYYTNWTIVCTSLLHITGLMILFFCNSLQTISVAIMVVLSEGLLIFFRLYGIHKFKIW